MGTFNDTSIIFLRFALNLLLKIRIVSVCHKASHMLKLQVHAIIVKQSLNILKEVAKLLKFAKGRQKKREKSRKQVDLICPQCDLA